MTTKAKTMAEEEDEGLFDPPLPSTVTGRFKGQIVDEDGKTADEKRIAELEKERDAMEADAARFARFMGEKNLFPEFYEWLRGVDSPSDIKP